MNRIIGTFGCTLIGGCAVVVALSAGSAHAAESPAPQKAAAQKAPAAQGAPAAQEAPAARGAPAAQEVIRLDETVISGNQELPKVLYILPWREPGGLPDLELQTDFTEMDVFRKLYPPAYRRELSYYKSLEATKSEE